MSVLLNWQEMARRVFVSSTSRDLVEFRAAAMGAIRRVGCVAVVMEDFPAGPRPALQVCLDGVETCDAVVAIVAHRYGDAPVGESQSYTELECRHAVDKLDKPLYAFLVDEAFTTWPNGREGDALTKAMDEGRFTPDLAIQVNAKVEALKAFKKWLRTGRVKAAFRTTEELSIEVERALREPGDIVGDTGAYSEWLREYCGWIELRALQVGSGKAHRFPIEDLYIPLRTSGLAAPDEQLERALQVRKLVIEGKPGSGKSTFLRKVARELPGFPILLRIADLDEYMRNCSTPGKPANQASPDWISHFLGSKGWGLNARYFDRRLRDGNTTLLLDGLDEAPDRLRRENIARMFEAATGIYKECRFVVTTRPRAYQGAAVLAGFEKVEILDLDDDAVAEFLKRWSRCLHPDATQAAEALRAELASALAVVSEVRRMARNPVMLTALAVVHWNERRLPEGRADLYESIVVWLARAREQRPGREKAETCLEWLGWLALEMQLLPGGRKAQVGRGVAAELLAKRLGGADPHRVAKEFLDQEEVDSGIIVTEGATDIKFWHLTFQEYLAARALAGRPDGDIHAAVLTRKRLYKPEWREVMTLLGGVLKGQGSEKVDALFNAILEGVVERPLADRVRCAALLGAMVRDLEPTGYKPSNPDYGKVLASMAEMFDRSTGAVDLRERVEAAEALGIDHPRLRLPTDNDYWISIAAGKDTKAFQIGRYPVTVFEYAKCVEAGGKPPWSEWEEQQRHPSRPVTYVDWNQATAYCEWAGVRLLTDAEWSRAAYGEGRSYPWGTQDPRPDLANCSDAGIGAPTPVGLFPNGNTPEGVADMIGNVWEWVEDRQESFRVLRGGCFGDSASALRPPARDGYYPVVRDLDFGFRAARD